MHGFTAGDLAAERTLAEPRIRSITIVRHGKPALDRSKRMNARRFITWWDEYDAGGLAAEGQNLSTAVQQEGARANYIVASTLRRARETAAAIAPGRLIEADTLFVEARLPPPLFPDFICLRPGMWGVLARIMWWLGFHADQESRADAEARAKLAATQLTALAGGHGSVMLVAHGWFNRMLRPELLAHGWVCVDDHGDSHWSFRRYEKPL